jgi:NADH oxidase (H2O2-forming)
MTKVVIIGGGAAGTTAAFELRKLDKDIRISILESGPHLQYSHCSIPYTIGREIHGFDKLFNFTAQDYVSNNISLTLNMTVTGINRKAKSVTYRHGKQSASLDYDSLIIATGSYASVPRIPGLKDSGFLTFKDLDDAKKIDKAIDDKQKATVIGAGLIGLELSHALRSRGLDVTVIESADRVLPGILDKDLSTVLLNHLASEKIKIVLCAEAGIEGSAVHVADHDIQHDMLIVACGVKPNTDLAEKAGLDTRKGIVVDKSLQTSDKCIYACGDCVESTDLVTGKPALSQLSTTAVRQAKVVAHNINGGKEEFCPVLNTTLSRLGKMVIGSAGITKERADYENISTVSAVYTGYSKEHRFPDAKELTVKLIADHSGRLIGAQLIGEEGVAGRTNFLSLAMQNRMKVEELSRAELGYNPAVSPVIDPITVAADTCLKKLNAKNAG